MAGKFRKEAEYFDADSVYDEKSQYMVYSHKQVRLRYIIQFTKSK